MIQSETTTIIDIEVLNLCGFQTSHMCLYCTLSQKHYACAGVQCCHVHCSTMYTSSHGKEICGEAVAPPPHTRAGRKSGMAE